MEELILQAWRKYPPPGWPFRDEERRLRPGPFTCLFMLIAFCLLLIVGLGVWRGLLASQSAPTPETLAQLSVGDCFSGWNVLTAASERKQTVVSAIDCAQPHESELFAQSPYSVPVPTARGPMDYPGAAALEAYSTMACREFLPSYVGEGQDSKRLRVSVAVVSDREWRSGDTNNLCIASFPTGPEAGSIREPTG